MGRRPRGGVRTTDGLEALDGRAHPRPRGCRWRHGSCRRGISRFGTTADQPTGGARRAPPSCRGHGLHPCLPRGRRSGGEDHPQSAEADKAPVQRPSRRMPRRSATRREDRRHRERFAGRCCGRIRQSRRGPSGRATMPTTSCPTPILELSLLGWCSRCAASNQTTPPTACGSIQRCMLPPNSYANVNAVVGKYYFNSFRPTSELVRDLQRLGELLQKGQLPL